MNLYLNSGYADMKAIINLSVPFIFVIGGRGTGKTFGALCEVLDSGKKFMFMRRTQAQADLISKPEFSPFKPISYVRPEYHIVTDSINKYAACFYNGVAQEDGSYKAAGAPLGYSCALSTISNMRGFDASDVEILLYDEFIPEKHERPIKNEGAALLNAYETINRNREISGEDPLKLVAMTNANDLASPIFLELSLMDRVEKMVKKRQPLFVDSNRGIAIVMLQSSPISEAKRNTALYRVTNGSDFERMSLNNEFASEDYSNVAVRPIEEYNPIAVYGDVCIYQHKSKKEYYCTRHISGNPPEYQETELGTKRFIAHHGAIYMHIVGGRVYFSDYYCKHKLTSIF